MLLFIVFDNGAAKTPAANSTSFGGLLSKPAAFLELTFLGRFLTSAVVAFSNVGTLWSQTNESLNYFLVEKFSDTLEFRTPCLLVFYFFSEKINISVTRFEISKLESKTPVFSIMFIFTKG